ncbi:hypothetical protein V502_11095 [Pseudogymnoascus sp. VKM F-4520 (FW-2644)]|nr:hypothetical protein V502_11095 [Pseudogymnoascus sp. VKM F-4520 (FW-2644)]
MPFSNSAWGLVILQWRASSFPNGNLMTERGAQDVAHVKQNGVSPSQFKNPSLQVTANQRIKMVDAPIRKPGSGEVLLHVKATGICGSDIHFWKRGSIGSLTVEGDCILGHEAAGVILEVGEGVSGLRKGDRVALEPQVPCGTCYCDTWPAGISALSGNVLNLDKLITHTFPLEQAMDAMELCSNVALGSIKIQVVDDRDIGPEERGI